MNTKTRSLQLAEEFNDKIFQQQLDKFTAAALTGLLCNFEFMEEVDNDPDAIAKCAAAQGLAQMKTREQMKTARRNKVVPLRQKEELEIASGAEIKEILGMTPQEVSKLKYWFENQSRKSISDFWNEAFEAGRQSQSPQIEYDAELFLGTKISLTGLIFDDKKQRFEDGERIITSNIEGGFIGTKNSVYKLINEDKAFAAPTNPPAA